MAKNAFCPPTHQYGHYKHVCTGTRNLISSVIITVSNSASDTHTWQSRSCHSSGGIPPNHYGCKRGHRHGNKVTNIECVMRARKKKKIRLFYHLHFKKVSLHIQLTCPHKKDTHTLSLTTVAQYCVKYKIRMTCVELWPSASLLPSWIYRHISPFFYFLLLLFSYFQAMITEGLTHPRSILLPLCLGFYLVSPPSCHPSLKVKFFLS